MRYFSESVFMGSGQLSMFEAALALRQASSAFSTLSGLQQWSPGTAFMRTKPLTPEILAEEKRIYKEMEDSLTEEVEDFCVAVGKKEIEGVEVQDWQSLVDFVQVEMKEDERFNLFSIDLMRNSLNYKFITGESPLFVWNKNYSIYGIIFRGEESQLETVLFYHRTLVSVLS